MARKLVAPILTAAVCVFSTVVAPAQSILQTQTSAPRLAEAKAWELLCAAITPEPTFNESEFFDEAFLKQVSKETLVSTFKKLATAHGSCTGRASSGSFAPYMTNGEQLLSLTDPRFNAVVRVRFSEVNGKIIGFSTTGGVLSPEHLEVTEQTVIARDGTRLRTLVFRPRGAFYRPTVLTRTPYFNINGNFSFGSNFGAASYYVGRGFNHVRQAVRGTGGSLGEPKLFNPQEIEDGADTVEWIIKQKFSDGSVAAVGTSYEGLTAAATGVLNPEGLKVVIAGAGPTDSSSGTFFLNGVLALATLDYIRYFTQNTSVPYTSNLSQKVLEKAQLDLNLVHYDELIYGTKIPEWRRWAEAYADIHHPFWAERSFIKRLPEIAVPTYHIAGLKLDGNMPDTFNNFMEIEKNSRLRRRHSLILGPWNHENITPAVADGSNTPVELRQRIDGILDHFLNNIRTPYVGGPRIVLPSHFSPEPLTGNRLPLLQMQDKSLYFATTASGARVLSERNESSTPSSEFMNKPLEIYRAGAGQDLEFVFEANEDLYLNGPLQAEMYLRIDTPQTDLFVQLSKLKNDGKSEFLTVCMPTTRLEAAPVISFKSRPCPVFNHLKKGEKLVAQLMSNAFPNTARNTGHAPADFFTLPPRNATIRLLHNPQFASRLILSLERQTKPMISIQSTPR